MISSVDEYILTHKKWQPELEKLREILLKTTLSETVKWGAPVYTVMNKNIVGIGAFKDYFGLWFFQGGTMKDLNKVLTNAQEGKTKAMRQWRFKSLGEIDEKVVLTYVKEAINNQKLGKVIKPAKANKEYYMPHELSTELKSDLSLDKAFFKLTSFKQKEYAKYIAEAKRDATKASRLVKIKPMILAGVGLNDKYR